MHAILLVSATHLSFLDPFDQSYHQASLLHLSKTLRPFQRALAQPLTALGADALIATSALLVHHAWATPDMSPIPSTNPDLPVEDPLLNLSVDPLFPLSQGLRQIIMVAFKHNAPNDSIFTSALHQRRCHDITRGVHTDVQSATELERSISAGSETPAATNDLGLKAVDGQDRGERTCEAANTSQRRSSWDTSFLMGLVHTLLLQFPLNTSMTGPHQPRERSPSPDAVDSDARPEAALQPLPDMARHLFYFPTHSTNMFRSLIKRNDSCVLLILFFYYRTIESLLPERQCWWCRKRVKILGPAIRRQLSARDEQIKTVMEEGEKMLEDKLARPCRPPQLLVDASPDIGADTRLKSWHLLERLGWRWKMSLPVDAN